MCTKQQHSITEWPNHNSSRTAYESWRCFAPINRLLTSRFTKIRMEAYQDPARFKIDRASMVLMEWGNHLNKNKSGRSALVHPGKSRFMEQVSYYCTLKCSNTLSFNYRARSPDNAFFWCPAVKSSISCNVPPECVSAWLVMRVFSHLTYNFSCLIFFGGEKENRNLT